MGGKKQLLLLSCCWSFTFPKLFPRPTGTNSSLRECGFGVCVTCFVCDLETLNNADGSTKRLVSVSNEDVAGGQYLLLLPNQMKRTDNTSGAFF